MPPGVQRRRSSVLNPLERLTERRSQVTYSLRSESPRWRAATFPADLKHKYLQYEAARRLEAMERVPLCGGSWTSWRGLCL